jgi:hypothetical protein
VLGRLKFIQLGTSEVEVATGKLKRYKFPGSHQIPAYCFKLGGKYCIQRSIKLLS